MENEFNKKLMKGCAEKLSRSESPF